jgi:HrpA-like RNA helicase
MNCLQILAASNACAATPRSESAHAGLTPDTPPEMKSADLAPLVLDLASWGADSADLPWLDQPPAGQMEAARDLLVRLGALDGGSGRVTAAGRRMAKLPLHPRMARMVLWRGAAQGECSWVFWVVFTNYPTTAPNCTHNLKAPGLFNH